MATRTFGTMLSLLCVTAVHAQVPLTEAEVVRLALEQGPSAAVATATESLAIARAETAGRLPNPSVTWGREVITTAPSFSQDIVTATFPISIAAPLSKRALASGDSARLRAQAAVSRSDAVLRVLASYYDAVAASGRVALLGQTVRNLEEASRVLASRERAGTASGYETSRLRIATELARSELAQARGECVGQRAQLAILLGQPAESLGLPASLEPSFGDVAQARAHLEASNPAALGHAREAVAHATTAGKRARWAWVPTLDVSFGLKRVSDFGGGMGYVVGLGLDVPLSDRGQALRAEADAGRALAAARVARLERQLQAGAATALARYETAREELTRFEVGVSDQVATLSRAAQSGYREGHRTLVELLDAQRTAIQVAERSLHLRLLAKRAEAQLRAVAGDFQ